MRVATNTPCCYSWSGECITIYKYTLLYAYFRFQIPLTSLRQPVSLPNLSNQTLSLPFITTFYFLFFSVVYLFSLQSDSTLTLCFIVLTLYSIYQITLYCIILYIYELSSSLTPFLCYSYSFEKRTIKSPIVTREEKRTDMALFSGRVTFFLREQKFWTRTIFWIFRASPNHATPIAFLSFFS